MGKQALSVHLVFTTFDKNMNSLSLEKIIGQLSLIILYKDWQENKKRFPPVTSYELNLSFSVWIANY